MVTNGAFRAESSVSLSGNSDFNKNESHTRVFENFWGKVIRSLFWWGKIEIRVYFYNMHFSTDFKGFFP